MSEGKGAVKVKKEQYETWLRFSSDDEYCQMQNS